MADITICRLKRNGWDTDEEPSVIDDSLLEYTKVVLDNDNEYTVAHEWRLDGKIVKRGAHVQLKRNVVADGIAAMLGA